MINKFKKIDLSIFFFISILVLIYTFYKSEIVWSGSKREYYFNYFILSSFLIILFSSSFFWSSNFIQYLRILIYTSIFSFYLSEFYLNSVNHKNKVLEIKKKIYLKKENKKFDERDKFTIYLDEKKLNNKISVASSPSNFLYENNKIFPLSGLSYSKTIDCNENGYYSTFLSDRYGFNNEDNDWSKKTINFLLIGDSNAMGSCVNPEQNIIGNLKKKRQKIF